MSENYDKLKARKDEIVARERAGLREAVLGAIPMNWLDDLLSGPNVLIGAPPYGCPDIERLLNAIKERQRKIFDERIDTGTGSEWREIADAPKEGKAFIVYCAERKNTYVVYRAAADDPHFYIFGSSRDELYEEPTHWQPLPLAPETDK